MGNAITLPVILTSLQNNCGCSAEEAADFIHAMTEAIINGLSSDGTVVVKGVGEFRIIDSGTEKTVEFRPDTSLAMEVNSPFSLFEPVVLSDGVTEDMLDTHTSTSDDSAITPGADNLLPQTHELKTETEAMTPGYVPQDTCECHENPDPVNFVDNATEAETPKATEPLPSGIPPLPLAAERADNHASAPEIYGTSVEANPAPEVSVLTCAEGAICNNDENEPPEASKATHRRKEIIIIVLVGLLSLLAGLLAGHFGIPGLNINGVRSVKITAEEVTLMNGENTPAMAEAEADTGRQKIAEEPAASAVAEPDSATVVSGAADEVRDSAPEIVTDTVQGTNYLSRIARRHYGKDIFWVYIYEENKDKIQDPNNICPGTVVVIPPADKYGIDPKSKASIQNAERLSGKILNKES